MMKQFGRSESKKDLKHIAIKKSIHPRDRFHKTAQTKRKTVGFKTLEPSSIILNPSSV